jgi:hypothetical protein
MNPNEFIAFIGAMIMSYNIRRIIFLIRQERLRRRLNGK